MRIYKIPLKYKSGEFLFHEIDTDEGDCLTLDYDSEYQLLTYNVPLYGGEARLYTVPRELMPEALTVVYDGNGDIEKVTQTSHTPNQLKTFKFLALDANIFVH